MSAIKPVRLQLSRRKGFDLQRLSRETNGLAAVKVARPGPFGNPFSVQDAADIYDCRAASAHHYCVGWFRDWITTPNDAEAFTEMHVFAHLKDQHAKYLARLPELRGKNLACFCKPDLACHVDVLLELANAPIRCEPLAPSPPQGEP